MFTPQLCLNLWEFPGAQHPTGDAFKAVDQLGQGQGWWVLNKCMDVIVLTIKFDELGGEVVADLLRSLADHLDCALTENTTSIFCYKDQMYVKQANDCSSSSVFCSFPLAYHN